MKLAEWLVLIAAIIGLLTAFVGLKKAIKESETLLQPRPPERVEDTTHNKIPPGYGADEVATPISPPQETVPTLSPQEEKLYYEALNLKESGSYNEALRKLGQLLVIQPDYVKAYILRGRIYLEDLNMYLNALEEFKESLNREPNSKLIFYYIGLTYYYLGDLEQAVNHNQKALDLDPDFIITVHQHRIYYEQHEKRLLQRLKKIIGEIPAPDGEDRDTIYQDLD